MKRLKRKLHLHNTNIMVQTKIPHSFHKSIAFLITLGQCFGLMPLNGILKSSERQLEFTWKSWKMLYTCSILIGTGFAFAMSWYDVFTNDSSVYRITSGIFFGSGLVVHVLFIRLAMKWPKLMRAYSAVEASMRPYGWPVKLHVRLKVMAACILIPATVEHVLVTLNNLIVSIRCNDGTYGTFEYFIVILSFRQIFSIVRYSVWLGIIAEYINVNSTFSWTFIDLFIILMSTSLALRFRQVTRKVANFVDTKVSDKLMWQSVREDYNRLCKLCYKINDCLSYIVLVSFGSNLFFILIQFFHSLRHMGRTVEKIYFFFSFGFLIIRTICVCLYGAWVNDESQKPLPLLNSVPSEIYNIEIRRFIIHISFDTVSLTGKRFFYLTRGLILSIAGTIVTYELVLIQFYGSLLTEVSRSNYTTC